LDGFSGEGCLSEDVLQMVYSAIDEVNGQFDGVVIQKKPDTRLLGSEGVDSVVFLNLVVALEELIEKERGISLVLVDQDNMASQEHPFRNVETLAAYVQTLLAKQPQD
jgi:acyl carrier protein